MVSSKVKSAIKFIISLTLALGLFWYVYRDTNLVESIAKLKEVKYSWVIFSMVLGAFAYYLRAVRWRLLLRPFSDKLPLFNVFNAVMVGYLVNLVVPRMGEISRCVVLKKSDNIAFTSSLGTVVTERLVDVLMLLLVTILTLLIEFENLAVIFGDLWRNLAKMTGSQASILVLGAFSILLLVLALLWIFRRRLGKSPSIKRFRYLLKELWQGLMSITKVKSQGLFWGLSLVIWIIYFFMAYIVFESMEATAGLDWRAGLSIMVMGGIGMAVPLPGGVGSFHGLVTQCLVLYGIAESDGGTFAFLVHSSQFIVVLILGFTSLVFALLITKKSKNHNHLNDK